MQFVALGHYLLISCLSYLGLAVMNAYAKCDAPDAAIKAESILQRLLADYTEGRSSIHPDTSKYDVLYAYVG